jgi:hypothetical protein
MVPHRVIAITDDPKDVVGDTYPLWDTFKDIPNPSGRHLPSCFRRLCLFNGAVTDAMKIPRDSKVVSMDLDVVIIRDLTPLFANTTDCFLGWKRISPGRPIEYQGSLFMLRAGRMQDVFDTFSPERSPIITRRYGLHGSDQAWISYVLRGAYPGWVKGDGIYSYSSDVHKKIFPRNARLVSFNGRWKPWHDITQSEAPWIRHYWR